MRAMSVPTRLKVLREDADQSPLPLRKFFHIGEPEVLDDLGECVPLLSWVDDNLSRFVVADGPSSTWGKGAPRVNVFPLPNWAVKIEDGIFLVSGAGVDRSVPSPDGKGHIHFIHLSAEGRLWDRPTAKIYVYRLDGVQFKAVTLKEP